MNKIIFATQAVVEKNMMKENDYFKYISLYLSSLKKIKNVRILIKLHPQEKHKKTYEKLVKHFNLNATVIQSGSGEYFLEELLDKGDVIITFKSSVLLMAMILKKPVISIGLLDGCHDLNDYYYSDKEDAAVMKVNKNDDISEAVLQILNDKKIRSSLIKKQNNYIKNYFYKVDGLAHKRISNIIENIIIMNQVNKHDYNILVHNMPNK